MNKLPEHIIEDIYRYLWLRNISFANKEYRDKVIHEHNGCLIYDMKDIRPRDIINGYSFINIAPLANDAPNRAFPSQRCCLSSDKYPKNYVYTSGLNSMRGYKDVTQDDPIEGGEVIIGKFDD